MDTGGVALAGWGLGLSSPPQIGSFRLCGLCTMAIIFIPLRPHLHLPISIPFKGVLDPKLHSEFLLFTLVSLGIDACPFFLCLGTFMYVTGSLLQHFRCKRVYLDQDCWALGSKDKMPTCYNMKDHLIVEEIPQTHALTNVQRDKTKMRKKT